MQMNIAEAKAKLSELIAAAEKGEEVIIARGGRPAVRLVSVHRPTVRIGIGDGLVSRVPDFLAPMSEDELRDWGVKVVLLDTHTFIWSLVLSSELSTTARDVIEAADVAYVAPISFYEITQKHRLGKWPELDPVIDQLLPLWRAQGTEIAPYTAEIAFLAGAMQWSHRDPFDRMIGATAIALACPLISKDAAFDALDGFPEWHGRIWDTASLPSPV